MKFRKLGNTDLNVSLICLGTMTYGEQNTQDEGFEQMDYAVSKGINFFDTAELYAIPPKKEDMMFAIPCPRASTFLFEFVSVISSIIS